MFREDILLSILHDPTFGVHVNKVICHKDIRLTTCIEWSADEHRGHLPVLLLHFANTVRILNKRERAFWLLHTYMPVEFVENNSFWILSVLCNKHNFTYSNTIMAVQEITSHHCKAILLNTPNYIICPSIILPHVAYMCSRSHKKTFNSQQLLWMDLFVDEHVSLPSSLSSSKTTTCHALWAMEQEWRTNVSRTHPLCPFQVLAVFRTFCLTALDLYPISLLFSHSVEYKVMYFFVLDSYVAFWKLRRSFFFCWVFLQPFVFLSFFEYLQ